jgi:phage terminase large subunit-like protein
MRKLKKYKPTAFMAKDSVYDKAAADYAVSFIQALCHTKGTWAGKPFDLIDWQEQIVRDVFGVLKPNGYRQFNTAYVEIPKKMGKSELAAAIALLLACGDNEERAEVYGCAADRQQASIVFEVAADMVRMCPALNRRVKLLASTKRLIYLPTNSFYQVLSAEAYSKHGFNIHGVVFDELHTQPNRKLYDVMTKGSGDARAQPLYFLITTAGDNQNSICWEVHQKALDIKNGRKHDSTFYPVIYGAALEDDWTDLKVWKKANPSLGITVSIDKVKTAFESARQNPAEENSFRQLRLNQWVKQAVRWMPMEKWDACINISRIIIFYYSYSGSLFSATMDFFNPIIFHQYIAGLFLLYIYFSQIKSFSVSQSNYFSQQGFFYHFKPPRQDLSIFSVIPDK